MDDGQEQKGQEMDDAPADDNPAPPQEEADEEEPEIYWPAIRPRLLGVADPRVRVQCAACLDPLRMYNSRITPAEEEAAAQAAEQEHPEPPEQACILVCGHVLGHRCLTGWILARRPNQTNATCPVCMRLISCLTCKRTCKFYVADYEDPPEDGHIPRTVGEGEVVLDKCVECEAKLRFQAHIESDSWRAVLALVADAELQRRLDHLIIHNWWMDPAWMHLQGHVDGGVAKHWAAMREIRRRFITMERTWLTRRYPWNSLITDIE